MYFFVNAISLHISWFADLEEFYCAVSLFWCMEQNCKEQQCFCYAFNGNCLQNFSVSRHVLSPTVMVQCMICHHWVWLMTTMKLCQPTAQWDLLSVSAHHSFTLKVLCIFIFFYLLLLLELEFLASPNNTVIELFLYFYLRQVYVVNGRDNVFIWCVCVSVCQYVCLCVRALTVTIFNLFWWNLAQTCGTWNKSTLSWGENPIRVCPIFTPFYRKLAPT